MDIIIDRLLDNVALRYAFYFLFSALLISIILRFIKLVQKPAFHPYQSISLFSNAEHSFFNVLHQSIPIDCTLFAKVRIADVLAPVKGLGQKSWYSAFLKISSKHFDYVLCDRKTLVVLAVIELDDKSHQSFKVRKRDAFVEQACDSADLKLLRFKCMRNYEIDAIRDFIQNALRQ